MFSIRIVTTSHYQAAPIPGLDVTYSEFRDGKVSKVPVLRIFGSTPAGQKTCMHVHGVFPYLYVPYDGTAPVDRYLRQFSASLDKAINIGNRVPNSNLQHVFKISVVSGIPMYGYHSKEQQLLKIYLYNPSNIRKAADLLLGGAVMNKPFQPHESHVSYQLQLFMDYNLYGMNLISVGALKFRRNNKASELKENSKDAKDEDEDTSSPSSSSSFLFAPTQINSVASSSSSSPFSSNRFCDKDSIPSEFWHPESIEKQSTCELEVDVIAADIINKQDLMNNVGNNPGLAALWEDERQRRRNAGLASQIVTEDSEEREGIDLSVSEKELLEKFADIVMHQQDFRDTQSTNELDESQSSIAASQVESHLSRQDSISSSQSTVILIGDGEENKEKTGNNSDDENDSDRAPIVSLDSINKVVASSQSFHIKDSEKSLTESQDLTVAGILAAILEEDAGGPSTCQQAAAALPDQDSILNATVVLDQEDLNKDDDETFVMSQAVIIDTGQYDKEPPDLERSGSSSESPDIVMNTDDESSDDIDLLPVPQFDGASDKIASHPPIQQQSDNLSASDINQSTNQQHQQVLQYSPDNLQQRGRPMQSNYQQQQQWQSQGGPSGDWQAKSPSWGTQQPQQQPPQMQQQQHPSYPSWQKQQPQPHQLQQQSGTPQPYSSPLHSQPSTPGGLSPFHSPMHNPYSSPQHHPGMQQSQYPAAAGGCTDYQSPSPSSSTSQPQPFPHHQASPFNSPQPDPQPINDSSPFHSTSYPYHTKHQQQGYGHYPTATPGTDNNTGDNMYQSPTHSHPYKSPSTDQMYQQQQQQQPSSAAAATSHNQSYQPQASMTDPMSPPPSVPNNTQYPFHQRSSHCTATTGKAYPQHPHTGFNYRSPVTGNQGFRTPPVCQAYSPVYPQSPMYSQQMSYQTSPQGSRYPSPSHPQSWSSPIGSPYNSGYFNPQHPMSSLHSSGKLTPDTMNYPNVPFGSSDSIASQGSMNPAEASNSKVGKKLSKEEQKYNKKQADAKKGVPTASNPGYARAVAPPKIGMSGSSTPHLLERDNETTHLPSELGASSFSTADSQQKTTPGSDNKPIADTEQTLFIANNHRDSSTAGEGNKTVADPCTTPMIQQLLMEESPAKVKITPPSVSEDEKRVQNSCTVIPTTVATASPTSTSTKGKKKGSKGKAGAKQSMRQRSASLTSSPTNLPAHMANPMLRHSGMPNMPHMPGGGVRPMGHRFPHHSMQQPFSPMSYSPRPTKNSEVSNSSMQHQHYSQVNAWQQQWGGQRWPNSEMPHMSDSNDNSHPGSRIQQRSYSADCTPEVYSSPSSVCGGQYASPQASTGSVGSNQVSGNEPDTLPDNFSTAEEKDGGTLSSLLSLMSEDGLWGDDTTPSLNPRTAQQQENSIASSQQLLSINSSKQSGQDMDKSPDTKEFITLEPASKSSMSSFDASGMTSSEESDRMDFEIAAGLIQTKTPGGPKSAAAGGTSHHPPKLGKNNKTKSVDMLCRDIVHSGEGASGGRNPAYTYTFHVPTRVFKRLKFYRSAQARKKHGGLKVLRMHPMDARKYSLLKIGKEVVNLVRLSDSDLAKYNVTLPRNLSPSDRSVNRVNLDIPLASSSRSSGGSGYGSDDGHSSMSSYDTDFPPNKVAPPSSLPSGPALSPRSRPTPSTPPSALSSTSMNNEGMTWSASQHYQMTSPSTHPQQPGFNSSSISSTSTSTVSNNYYNNPSMPPHGTPHPLQQRMNPYRPAMPPVGSPDQYNNFYYNRNGSYRPNTTMPVYNGGQQANTMTSPSFPHNTQYNMNSGHPQPYYNNPSGFDVHNQHPQVPPDRMRMENGMHNTYSTTSAPLAPNQKNGLRSPGQHGPITHTIDTDMLSDVSCSGDDEDNTTTLCLETTTTTTACLVNARVTAQFGSVHAQNNNQALPSSCHMKPDKDVGNPSSKFSIINTAARFKGLFESDYSNYSEPTLPGSQVSDKKIKHRKSRRKRDKRSSLRKAVSNCSENKDGNVAMNSITSDVENGKISELNTKNLRQNETTEKDSDAESYTKFDQKHTSSLVLRIKADSYLSDDTYLGRKKNKNWKSLRLKIPKRDFSPIVNHCSGSVASSDGVPENTCKNDVEMQGENVLSEIKAHETKDICSDQTKHSMRQSTRQAKLRSVLQSENSDTEKKSKRKRICRKEGIHYIIVNKFRGHKKMQVKIPRVPVRVGEGVDAKQFIQSSQRDVVRNAVIVDSDQNDSVYPIESAVQISIENDTERSGEEEAISNKDDNDSSNFLKADPPDSAATSPETPFFCRLKKTFIKRQGGKGWINVSQRVKRRINVFFPGVVQRMFVRFQATFHDNVAKQEDVQDYSSSSDDEDDYLDDIILRGKVRQAKEEGIKKDLIMERLNQSETFSLAEIPSKIPLADASVDQSDNAIANFAPDTISHQHSELQPFNFSPITPASNLTSPYTYPKNDEENILMKWPNISLQNSNIVGHMKDSHNVCSQMLSKDTFSSELCSASHTSSANMTNVDNTDNVSEHPTPKVLSNTSETTEDRMEFIKRQMAFYEDISSDADSDDTIIDSSKPTTATAVVQSLPPPINNSDNLSDLEFESISNESKGESEKIESKTDDQTKKVALVNTEKDSESDAICNIDVEMKDAESKSKDTKLIHYGNENSALSTEGLKSDDAALVNTEKDSESDTICNIDVEMKDAESNSKDTKLIYHGNENSALSAEGLKSDDADKTNTNNGESDIDEERAELCDEESPCEVVKLNICDLEARPQENMRDTSVTYNDLMSLKIDTKKGRKGGSKSKGKLQSDKSDKGYKSGNCKRNKRKETEFVLGLASSSNDERGSSPLPAPTKRLRQRKQTKYTFHVDGLDSSSSSSDIDDFPDFDNVQRKGRGNRTKTGTESQPTVKKSNQRLPIGRRKKGSGNNNKLFNSLSVLHMATLANLTESQDSPASPTGQDQASEVTDTVTPDFEKVNDDNCENMSSLDTMLVTTPPDEEETETSPPTAISPAEKVTQDKKRNTKTSTPCRVLNFSNYKRNRLKPGYNGSSNIGTKPLVMNHFEALSSASSSPLPLSFLNHKGGETADQQGSSSNASNAKFDLDKASGTVTFSMKQILRMSMKDDSMDSDSKDSPALIKPRDSKRAQVKSTTLSMSDIMKMTSTANEDEENTEVCHTILTGSNKDLNPSGGCIAEVKDVALSFKDIINMTKEHDEAEESDVESVCSIPKPLSTDAMKDDDVKVSPQSKVAIDDVKNSSFDLIENSLVKSTSSSSDLSMNNESNSTSKSDLLPDLAKDNEVIDESILDEEKSTSQQKMDSTADGCRKESLKMKCLSPLSCIIEESQISRTSQDEFTSSEPDTMGTPAKVTPNINNKSSLIPSSVSAQTVTNENKDIRKSTITENNQSPDVIESSQENVKPVLSIPVITNTLAAESLLNFDCDKPNSGTVPTTKSWDQREISPLQALQIPPSLQVPLHIMSPSSLSSKSFSGPSPHHSYPWCWKWQEQPQRIKELQNCPLNLSTSSIGKPTTAIYSPITPTSPISACPSFPPPSSTSKISPKDSMDSKLSPNPPSKKPKALWYPWLSPKDSSFRDDKLTSNAAQDAPITASEEIKKDCSVKTQKSEFTKVKDSKPQKNLKISECSSISQFVGSVIETAYDMGSKLEAKKNKSEIEKKCLEKSKCSISQTVEERLETKYENPSLHKDTQNSFDKSFLKNNHQTSAWYDPYQYHLGQQQMQMLNHLSSQSFNAHHSKAPITCTVTTQSSSSISSRKREDDERIRNMLENERALRGQFGLDTPGSNGKQTKSPSLPSPNHMSLTDLLITQLIKGDGGGAYQGKEAAASRKRGQKNCDGKDKKDADGSTSNRGRKDIGKDNDDVAGGSPVSIVFNPMNTNGTLET